jgi:hypothetical protein
MDPSKEVFDEEDDEVIPEDDDANQIVPAVADYYEEENKDQEEEEADAHLPEQLEHHLAGIPREIRNFQTFFNPYPQSEWENLTGEAAVFIQQENALI